MTRLGPFWTLIALLAAAPHAHAIDDTTRTLLRQLSTEGVAAYQAGDYPAAVQKLERAWGILPTAPLGLWSGRALEQAGRLAEASERYLAAQRAELDAGGDRAAQEAARADAEAAYQAIQARVPTVTIHLEGARAEDLVISVGGKVILTDLIGLPVPVDPGQVLIEASPKATGTGPTQRKTIVVVAGDRQALTLTFASPAESLATPAAPQDEAPSATGPQNDAPRTAGGWQRTTGWIGIGVGGAGLILGAITGAVVLGKHNELCPTSGPCNAGPDETASLNSLRTVSSVGFIAGAAFAAAGVTLLLTAPSAKTQVALSPYVTFDSVGVTGWF